MNKNSCEYEKHICFFLDKFFNKQIDTVAYKYHENPNKEFIKYIVQYSENENYTFSFPMSVFWNLTSACNLRCEHCLYNQTGYDATNDLSPEQANRLANELIEMGVTYVVLSGGEIFLRPDLMGIIREFKKHNIAIRLLTNAILPENKQITELGELFNPYTDSVSVSFDAATKETLKRIRRTEYFEKIIENINKLVENNVKVDAVCTVNSINYNEAAEIYKLAKDLKLNSCIFGKMSVYNETHHSLLVSNQQLFELYYKLSGLKKSPATKLTINFWTPMELLNIKEVRTIIETPHYQNLIQKIYTKPQRRICHYQDRIAIKADGMVYLCLEAIVNDMAPLGSYKNNSVTEIWENRFNNPLFTQNDNPSCGKCRYNCFCDSGCLVKINSLSGKCSLME